MQAVRELGYLLCDAIVNCIIPLAFLLIGFIALCEMVGEEYLIGLFLLIVLGIVFFALIDLFREVTFRLVISGVRRGR